MKEITRDCNNCVYSTRDGFCGKFECSGTVTVEDIKAEARQSAIDEFKDLGKLYSEIRADAIDECIKVNHIAWERYVNDYSLGQKRRGQLNAMFVGILDMLEQLKEQNN